MLLGLWLIAAPFVLAGGNSGATINSVVVGLAVAALSVPRGKVVERYDTGIRRSCEAYAA